MSIGTVAFKKNLNTTDQEQIKLTHARALRIALSDTEEEATYQGFGARYGLSWLFGDVETKTQYNKKIFDNIRIKPNKLSKDKSFDFTDALTGETPSYIINKFINFNKLKNSKLSNDQTKFNISINYSKSIYGTESYKITFSIQDDEASMTSQDQVDYKYNKLTNLLHNRKNSMTLDLSEEEALFISQYIKDENTGTLIDNIDPAQVAMQYLLSKQDISGYKNAEEIEAYELEGPDGEIYKTVCDEQKTYIKTIVDILRKDFTPINTNNIKVTKEEDGNKNNIELEFSINNNDKIRIQYEELLEKTIDAFGKETFKVIRKTNPYIIKVSKDIAKEQNNIDRRNNNITKPVLSTLSKQHIADRCNNILSNIELKIVNYAIVNAHKYEAFLQNNPNLRTELKSINAVDIGNNFARKLVGRLKHADAWAAACNFFMNDIDVGENIELQKRDRIIQQISRMLEEKNTILQQIDETLKEKSLAIAEKNRLLETKSPVIAERHSILQKINKTLEERNRILKELEELDVPKEILVAKLLNKIQLTTNQGMHYLEDYAPIVKDYTKNIGNYYSPLLKKNKFALAFYLASNVHEMKSIDRFFNNSGITCQKLYDILSLSNYDKKEKNIALLKDIPFAQDKRIIDQIKQLEIEKICTENRNSVLELIAIRHPELNCYSIQNPFDKQNIAYAIRDNSSSFARDQMITDKKQLLSEVEYRQYKKAKQLVEKELDKIAQSVDEDDLTSNQDEYSNNYHSVYNNTEDYNTNDTDDDTETDFSFDDDIESSDDRIGKENKILQARSKVNGVERNHSPIELTKRYGYIGEEKVSHDQIYINSLMQFYSMLGIREAEIPL